jgi:phage terminase large subunit GpA-like protein
MSKVERHQKSGKAKKFGIRLWHVDSSYGKDELARLVSEEEPTYFYPAPMEADYYEQLAAEHKIVIRNKTTGRASTEWVAISVGADNHWLDASVYEYFAAHMIGVANLPDGLRWKPGAAAQAIPIRKKTKRFVTATVTRGGVQGGFRRRR